jgi:transposase
MSSPQVLDDAIWKKIEKILPTPAPRNHLYAGRKPVDPRKVISGIVHVIAHKIPWEDLPQDLGFGSGMTCWRRLRMLQDKGVWDKISLVLRRSLPDGANIDLARAKAPKKTYRTNAARKKLARKTGKPQAKAAKPAPKASAGKALRAAQGENLGAVNRTTRAERVAAKVRPVPEAPRIPVPPAPGS